MKKAGRVSPRAGHCTTDHHLVVRKFVERDYEIPSSASHSYPVKVHEVENLEMTCAKCGLVLELAKGEP